MASFIELPRMHQDGRDNSSWFVNTADIIAFQAEYDGTTRVEVRGIGNMGVASSVVTYAPLSAIVRTLEIRAEEPGVTTWADDTKRLWAKPLAEARREQYAAERAVR